MQFFKNENYQLKISSFAFLERTPTMIVRWWDVIVKNAIHIWRAWLTNAVNVIVNSLPFVMKIRCSNLRHVIWFGDVIWIFGPRC